MKDLGQISYADPEEEYVTFWAEWQKATKLKYGLVKAIWTSMGFQMLYTVLPSQSYIPLFHPS